MLILHVVFCLHEHTHTHTRRASERPVKPAYKTDLIRAAVVGVDGLVAETRFSAPLRGPITAQSWSVATDNRSDTTGRAGRTDRRTDGQTDGPTTRRAISRTHVRFVRSHVFHPLHSSENCSVMFVVK